ncbi:hypothetical protein AVEN_29332-1 [Araneus ventricosus]|uniref:Uncharacterized protein n=1 Tax=Araneus ventricosus TaxID=182803 RepID=A0A4Y2IY61_ARAVE|nr:hypothetical protein AVEN_29332-1 [Araneus ventricosus]
MASLLDMIKEVYPPRSKDKRKASFIIVNHSLHFVDADTGVHTQSIEGTRSAIKRGLNEKKHVKDQFDSYKRKNSTSESRMASLLDMIKVYPPRSKDKRKASFIIVNHSLHFVDADTGVHTQSIERTWSAIKRGLNGKKTCEGPI